MAEVRSSYADEGTLAHKIAEFRIKEIAFGIDLSAMINPLKLDALFTEEMMGFVDDYATFVVERVKAAPPGALLVQEHRLNYHEFVPEGFGTLDNGIPAPGVLEIIDLKYGKGVPVDAYENEQLMIYALGMLLDYDILFDIEKVKMTIYQPRIDNISTYEMSREDLYIWANQVLKPVAKIAFAGMGELIPGDHCRFCKVAPVCEANAKMNLALAAKEFDLTGIITDEQVVKVLLKADSMEKWIKSVKAHALRMALEGYKWPGMKIVQGRSVRKYGDTDAIVKGLVDAGYSEEKMLTKKLLAMTHLKKIVSKLHFEQYVDPYLIKPPGKPALVPADDKRPEWNSIEAAAADFEDESQDELE